MDDEIRRQAVEEAKEEILAQLRSVLEEMRNPLQLVRCKPTEEAVEEARRLAEQFQSSASSAYLGAPLTLEPPQIIESPLLERWRRLVWLLGLCDAERSFVCAAAEAHADRRHADLFDGLAVFADWLTDAGRSGEAGACRALTPQDGDVLAFWFDPQKEPRPADVRQAAMEIVEMLAARGKEVQGLILPVGVTADLLADEELAKMGCVRADDIATKLRSLLAAFRAGVSGGVMIEALDGLLQRLEGRE